jgi:cyclic pyranopterin phosphate synthase
MMTGITDKYGRSFKTLRVSLNHACNFACSYCVDPSKLQLKSSNEASLSSRKFLEVITALHSMLQLDTIRLTGGEPLLYKELESLVYGIREIGIKNIKMTTNGSLLEQKAADLKNAGLSSINISLDALDNRTSFKITKRRKLESVLRGIDKAVEVGMDVKINCVVMKGINDDEIVSLFEFCKERNIVLRFLELMQMGHLYNNFEEYYFPEAEIVKVIASQYILLPEERKKNETAKYWMTKDCYKFGVISNVSNPFCNDCNRLRLDSYGNIYGCLSSNSPVNIMEVLHDRESMKEKLAEALGQKQMRFSGSELSMLHIGG